MCCRLRAVVACVVVLISSSAVGGQVQDDRVALVVEPGRPLRVRLNERVTIEHVGQIGTATVADPVFAYDRVVIPAGAAVTGHIAGFAPLSRWARVRSYVLGDCTPQTAPV